MVASRATSGCCSRAAPSLPSSTSSRSVGRRTHSSTGRASCRVGRSNRGAPTKSCWGSRWLTPGTSLPVPRCRSSLTGGSRNCGLWGLPSRRSSCGRPNRAPACPTRGTSGWAGWTAMPSRRRRDSSARSTTSPSSWRSAQTSERPSTASTPSSSPTAGSVLSGAPISPRQSCSTRRSRSWRAYRGRYRSSSSVSPRSCSTSCFRASSARSESRSQRSRRLATAPASCQGTTSNSRW